MKKSIEITEATFAHENELKRISNETSMPGAIRLAYCRNPNFFDSLSVLGQKNNVGVAIDVAKQKVVGFGVRSIKNVYINDKVESVGYLSNLRLMEEYRGTRALIKGFKYLEKLHQDQHCSFYLTTIMSDNKLAKRLLTTDRAGLPHYHYWGKYNTYLIAANDRKKIKAHLNITIDLALPTDLTDIVKFLQNEGKNKQFFPFYDKQDLLSDSGMLRGLSLKNILIAKMNQEIVGLLGLWDQNNFKQITINGYNAWLGTLRPIYNLIAKIKGSPKLEPPGSLLNLYYGAMVVVKNNDSNIFEMLLNKALCHTFMAKKAFIALGFHESDSLNITVNRYRKRIISSDLYLVSFDQSKSDFLNLKQKIPYLELGAL